MISGKYYMWVCKLHFFHVLVSDLLLWVLWVNVLLWSKSYTYIGVFEQIGDFSYLWAVVGECSPEILDHSIQFMYGGFFVAFVGFIYGVGLLENCCYWLLFVVLAILFVFSLGLVEGNAFCRCGIWRLPFFVLLDDQSESWLLCRWWLVFYICLFRGLFVIVLLSSPGSL